MTQINYKEWLIKNNKQVFLRLSKKKKKYGGKITMLKEQKNKQKMCPVIQMNIKLDGQRTH